MRRLIHGAAARPLWREASDAVDKPCAKPENSSSPSLVVGAPQSGEDITFRFQ